MEFSATEDEQFFELDANIIDILKKKEFYLYDDNISINLLDYCNIDKKFITTTCLIKIIELYANLNRLKRRQLLRDDLIIALTDKIQVKYWGITVQPFSTVDKEIVTNKRELYREEKILSSFSDIIGKFYEGDFDVYEILTAIQQKHGNITYLAEHPKINKLCVSVLFDKIDKIRENLLTTDPRYNNSKAYRLAIKRGDLRTKIILDDIVTRILLHKAVLTKFFYHSSLVRDIYVIMSKMF